MRFIVGVVLAVSLAAPAIARQAPLPPTYAAAEESFSTLESGNRAFIQILMTAAGYWTAVPAPKFGLKLFNAVSDAQADLGLPRTGIMDLTFIKAVGARSRAPWAVWGIREYRHPVTGTAIYIPEGLGLQARSRGDSGNVTIENMPKGFSLDFNYFPRSTLDTAYIAVLNNSTDDEIIYQVKRDNFFVVYARKNGILKYNRYQVFGAGEQAGAIGFNLWYRENDPILNGDRLMTLISGKLAASVTGIPYFTAEPSQLYPQFRSGTARAPDIGRPVPATPAALPPNNPTVTIPKSSSGSGYYVSAAGHIVSNNHVIEGCQKITVKSATGSGDAKIIALDKTNDLALIKVDIAPPRFGVFRRSVRQGESVAAYGYPLTGYLSQNGNFTIGNVSALTGLDDDSRALQVSTPIQPGNSGGPLVDERGNIVGTIESKLNAMKMASTTNDIAQNVNFAIKSSVTAVFLESNGVDVVVAQVSGPEPVLSSADLAEKVRAFTVSIQCMRS